MMREKLTLSGDGPKIGHKDVIVSIAYGDFSKVLSLYTKRATLRRRRYCVVFWSASTCDGGDRGLVRWRENFHVRNKRQGSYIWSLNMLTTKRANLSTLGRTSRTLVGLIRDLYRTRRTPGRRYPKREWECQWLR